MSEELEIPTVTYRDIDAVYWEESTVFYNAEREELFRVDGELSVMACEQIVDIYFNTFSKGDHYGYQRAVETVHTLLGVNKLVAALEFIKRGY